MATEKIARSVYNLTILQNVNMSIEAIERIKQTVYNLTILQNVNSIFNHT